MLATIEEVSGKSFDYIIAGMSCSTSIIFHELNLICIGGGVRIDLHDSLNTGRLMTFH